MGFRRRTLTPSAPRTKSPEKEVPSSSVTVAVSTSTAATRLDVLSVAGVPSPPGDVARRLSSSWSRTRWESTHGCFVPKDLGIFG